MGFLVNFVPWQKLPLQGTQTAFPMLPSFEYWTCLTHHYFTYLCYGGDAGPQLSSASAEGLLLSLKSPVSIGRAGLASFQGLKSSHLRADANFPLPTAFSPPLSATGRSGQEDIPGLVGFCHSAERVHRARVNTMPKSVLTLVVSELRSLRKPPARSIQAPKQPSHGDGWDLSAFYENFLLSQYRSPFHT